MSVNVDGEKLREAREDALMSQRELAEEAGVSQDTIMRLELGVGGTYGRTLRRIANALDRDYREFLPKAEAGFRSPA